MLDFVPGSDFVFRDVDEDDLFSAETDEGTYVIGEVAGGRWLARWFGIDGDKNTVGKFNTKSEAEAFCTIQNSGFCIGIPKYNLALDGFHVYEAESLAELDIALGMSVLERDPFQFAESVKLSDVGTEILCAELA